MDDPSINTTQRLNRLALPLGLIGGMALAAAYLTHPPAAPPATVASTMWIWIHVGFMLSLLAGIFLLVLLASAYVSAGGSWRGITAFVFSVTSLVFVFGLDYSEVFIFPTLAVEFPEVVVKYGDGTSMPSVAFAFPATGALFVIGFIWFSVELARMNVISTGTCWLTIVGTLIFGAGLSGVFPMIVVRIGSVIYGCALIWLGKDLALGSGNAGKRESGKADKLAAIAGRSVRGTCMWFHCRPMAGVSRHCRGKEPKHTTQMLPSIRHGGFRRFLPAQ